MNYDELLMNFIRMDDLQILMWAINNRLLKSSSICVHCSNPMVLKRANDSIDKYEWRCCFTKCPKKTTSNSVRSGSCIEGMRISILALLKILINWSSNLQPFLILRLISVTEPTLLKVRRIIQKKIIKYFEENPIVLGGPNIVCMVDETKINFNVKSHRGRAPVEPVWLFVITDTSTSPALGYCEIVPNRTSRTLISIIERVVRPGSFIYSDEWPSYNSLKQNNNFEFGSVCHKYNFVNPTNGVHIQNAESYNNKIKMRIKAAKGINKKEHKVFLVEFMWKELGGNIFEKIVNLLKW